MPVKILIHVCCGPCSIMPFIKLLENGFNPVGYFFNPNIHPLNEYIKRRGGVKDCSMKLNVDILYDDEAWNFKKWIARNIKFDDRNIQCKKCIGYRLEETFKKANKENINYVTTTLLFSIYQPHEYIKLIGKQLEEKYGINFIYFDFRKYWHYGERISKIWNIYRQAYCGCIFSEIEKNYSKLRKFIG